MFSVRIGALAGPPSLLCTHVNISARKTPGCLCFPQMLRCRCGRGLKAGKVSAYNCTLNNNRVSVTVMGTQKDFTCVGGVSSAIPEDSPLSRPVVTIHPSGFSGA